MTAPLPLVLLHGIGSNARSWGEQVAAFCVDREVLAWDMPGYGGAPALHQVHPTPDDYAGELSRYLDRQGIEACDIVGHSLGAIIATRFALREPRRVRRLILSNPAAGYCFDRGAALPEHLQSRIDQVRALGPAGLAARRARNTVAEGASPDVIKAVTEAMASVNVEGYVQATWLLAQGDVAADLDRLHVPVSFLCGASDRVVPFPNVQKLADGRRLVAIANAGHASYADHPTEYNAALRRLLDN